MTFFGALETIASREVTVNRASRKNREFDRKYDMSIHGNIYILDLIVGQIHQTLQMRAISRTYKAI
jgi:hypothetical protein